MLLPLFASAVVAAGAAESPAGAPAPAPTIDSLLHPPGPETTDTDEDGAPAPGTPQGPVPYSQLDSRSYDDALRSAAATARIAAGPLDGGWILATADGRGLYRFQFQGRGYGLMEAEGAWRDLDGGPRLAGSGFIDQVGYSGDQLMLRFHEGGVADEVVVTVKANGTGAWAGQLKRHGALVPVVFRRDG